MRSLLPSLVLSVLAWATLRGLWPGLRTVRGSGLFALAVVLVHGGFLAAKHPGAGVFTPLSQAALTAWMVASLVTIAIGVPLRVLGFFRTRVLKRPPLLGPVPAAMAGDGQVDGSRRRFLGMALPVTAASVGTVGTAAAFNGFEVRHEAFRIPNLPPALDGLRIGHLTDVHVGDFIDTDYLRRAVEALDAEGVDLQVMTGDLIDDMAELEPTMDALESTRAPLGMVAVIGNHEIWRGERQVLQAYARRAPNGRLRFLQDQNLLLEHNGAPLRIVGVDYPMLRGGRHRPPKEVRDGLMKTSAEKGWKDVGEGETVLCLTHHPDFFPHAAARGAALTLAGHTHGGQVGFLRMPLFFFAYEHMIGRYRRGPSQLYVGSGTGHWLPFRVGMAAEVTVITLRAA